MTNKTNQDEWEPAYKQGQIALMMGHSDETNPHGKGDMMNRCAWFAGWHDKRREGNLDGY